jgi:hypothetical protein
MLVYNKSCLILYRFEIYWSAINFEQIKFRKNEFRRMYVLTKGRFGKCKWFSSKCI